MNVIKYNHTNSSDVPVLYIYRGVSTYWILSEQNKGVQVYAAGDMSKVEEFIQDFMPHVDVQIM